MGIAHGDTSHSVLAFFRDQDRGRDNGGFFHADGNVRGLQNRGAHIDADSRHCPPPRFLFRRRGLRFFIIRVFISTGL